jgi:hypothetical protein
MIKLFFLFIFYYNYNLTQMSINLQSFENDIDYFTNNFCKFKVLILFVENNNLTSILKKNINVKNNYISNKELIQYIQTIKELSNYKIQYLLILPLPQIICETLLSSTSFFLSSPLDFCLSFSRALHTLLFFSFCQLLAL